MATPSYVTWVQISESVNLSAAFVFVCMLKQHNVQEDS